MHLGQEIYLFFYKYNLGGFFGIFFSGIIFYLIISKTLYIIYYLQINTYSDFLDFICPKNNKVNLPYIFNIIINLFLLISFYIMVAGFASFFNMSFNIPTILTSTIIAFVCYIILNKNISGLIKINSILIPLIIFLIFFIGYKNISNFNYIFTYTYNFNWILSSLLYTSYNSILLIPVLISLKQLLKNKTSIILCAIITVLIIVSLSCIIYFILLNNNINYSNIELPILYVSQTMGNTYTLLYSLIILSAIFTTLISSGFAFINNCSTGQISSKYINFFMCFSSIFVSNFGFSNLVGKLYPVFGFIGLIQLFLILKKNY